MIHISIHSLFNPGYQQIEGINPKIGTQIRIRYAFDTFRFDN